MNADERNRKMNREYPYDLLKALNVNGIVGSDMDYHSLTKDQEAGLNYILSIMPDRIRTVMLLYYRDNKSKKQIAEELGIVVNRVEQALRKGKMCGKWKKKEWLSYIANGYEATEEYLQEQLRIEEEQYKRNYNIQSQDHIYYQDIEALHFTARIYNPLKKAGVRSVRDLLLFVGTEKHIRHIGDISSSRVVECMKEEGLLPEKFTFEHSVEIESPLKVVERNVFKRMNEMKKITQKLQNNILNDTILKRCYWRWRDV